MFADWVDSQTGHSQRTQQLDFWVNSLLIDNISGSSAPFQAAAMNELSSRDWQLEPLELLAPNLFSTHWCNNPWCKAPVCVRSRRSVWLPAAKHWLQGARKDLWAEADCLDYSRVETVGLGPGIITAQSGTQQPWRSLRLYKRLTACELDHPTFSSSDHLLSPLHLHLREWRVGTADAVSLQELKFDIVYALGVKWMFGQHNFNLKPLANIGTFKYLGIMADLNLTNYFCFFVISQLILC